MPHIVGSTQTAVETPVLKIDELCGNVACASSPSSDTLSIAMVTAASGSSEPWLTLDYEEWICMLTGSMVCSIPDGPKVVCNAGEVLYVGKGERFKPSFPVDSTYVPVCIPAFKPSRCLREDTTTEGSAVASNLRDLHASASSFPPPEKPAPEVLYHMCPRSEWEECVEEKKCYYPQTYVTDGHYTHATGVPSRLVTTANRFYQDSVGAWICLKFTRKALYDRGVHVKDERAMPVGEKKVSEEWGEWVCPHVMGGLVTDVVDKVYDMRRDEKGGFVGIEGLEGA